MLGKKSSQSIYKRQVKKINRGPHRLRMVKIAFANNSMLIYLIGGRVLYIPLSQFPEIKQLTKHQREHYHIAGGISLDFDDSDEVYHIEELLGMR